MRVGICSPRLEIFCCKLALFLISPRELLGSVCVFLLSSEFCRALFETAQPAICTLLISARHFLKSAAARFHASLVSPGYPLSVESQRPGPGWRKPVLQGAIKTCLFKNTTPREHTTYSYTPEIATGINTPPYSNYYL